MENRLTPYWPTHPSARSPLRPACLDAWISRGPHIALPQPPLALIGKRLISLWTALLHATILVGPHRSAPQGSRVRCEHLPYQGTARTTESPKSAKARRKSSALPIKGPQGGNTLPFVGPHGGKPKRFVAFYLSSSPALVLGLPASYSPIRPSVKPLSYPCFHPRLRLGVNGPEEFLLIRKGGSPFLPEQAPNGKLNPAQPPSRWANWDRERGRNVHGATLGRRMERCKKS